jgi:hypothetical protein
MLVSFIREPEDRFLTITTYASTILLNKMKSIGLTKEKSHVGSVDIVGMRHAPKKLARAEERRSHDAP